MGRELKRVPLDFEWPLGKTWQGFLNPHYKGHCSRCEACDGDGYSPKAKELKNWWYGLGEIAFRPEFRGSKPFDPRDPLVWEINRLKVEAGYITVREMRGILQECERMCQSWNSAWCHHLNQDDVAALIAAGRLYDFTHTWSRENGWQPKEPPIVPTPDQVNRWSLAGMGHDSCNEYICVKAECKRLGIDTTCAQCKGEGSLWDSPENKQKAEDWEREQPPVGEGYQLWETVSEGSPISPVFNTPEALALWLANSHEYKWRKNDKGITYEQWLAFIKGPGWAPSAMVVDGKFMTGVEAVSDRK